MNLKHELFRVTEALTLAGIDYALCGGLAVAVHGYPRATRDIDILILEGDLDQSRNAMEEIGYTLSSGNIPFDAGQPTERRVFRISKAEDTDILTLDLILVAPFLQDVWEGREEHLVEGKTLQVVSLDGLTKMKHLAGRPQDLADLSQLGVEDDKT